MYWTLNFLVLQFDSEHKIVMRTFQTDEHVICPADNVFVKTNQDHFKQRFITTSKLCNKKTSLLNCNLY